MDRHTCVPFSPGRSPLSRAIGSRHRLAACHRPHRQPTTAIAGHHPWPPPPSSSPRSRPTAGPKPPSPALFPSLSPSSFAVTATQAAATVIVVRYRPACRCRSPLNAGHPLLRTTHRRAVPLPPSPSLPSLDPPPVEPPNSTTLPPDTAGYCSSTSMATIHLSMPPPSPLRDPPWTPAEPTVAAIISAPRSLSSIAGQPSFLLSFSPTSPFGLLPLPSSVGDTTMAATPIAVHLQDPKLPSRRIAASIPSPSSSFPQRRPPPKIFGRFLAACNRRFTSLPTPSLPSLSTMPKHSRPSPSKPPMATTRMLPLPISFLPSHHHHLHLTTITTASHPHLAIGHPSSPHHHQLKLLISVML